MNKKIMLADKSCCTGCSACFDICPVSAVSMLDNGEGFLLPHIDSSLCIKCGKCISVCPEIVQSVENLPTIKRAYAGWLKDYEKRKLSTSGGAFQAFATTVIDNGGYVIGAMFDDNFDLYHSAVADQSDLIGLYGSKYLQSDTRNIFKKTRILLESGKIVLFSGTPCQVRALTLYIPTNLSDKLLTCDLLCHGIQSPGLFKKYKMYLEEKYNGKLIKYCFRSKINGWGKESVSFAFSNGKSKSFRTRYCPYHTWFGAHISIRESCFSCKYRRLERVSDITIGDFWGIEKLKSGIDTTNGVSLIYTNTEKGNSFLHTCEGKIVLKEVNVSETLRGRKIMLNNYPKPPERDRFFVDYELLDIKSLIKKYPPSTFIQAIISKIKSVVSRYVK